MSGALVSLTLLTWVVTGSVQLQRPDAVRHELSRFNHAIRSLTTASSNGSVRSIIWPASGNGTVPSSALSSDTTNTSLPAVTYRTGRLARFVPQFKVLRLAVLAPSDPEHQFSLLKILPAITLAARTIERSSNSSGGGPLPGWKIQIVDRDSKCSSIHGPLEAIDLYNSKALGSSFNSFSFLCTVSDVGHLVDCSALKTATKTAVKNFIYTSWQTLSYQIYSATWSHYQVV